MHEKLLQSAVRTIRRDRLLPQGTTVVVGYSAGPDSTALLHVLRELSPELRLRVVAAHLDHALRADSAQDATFARRCAASWGVELRVERVDWASRGGFPTADVEARARTVRYEFLGRVAAELDGVVAVGHHADDRLETMLAQWIRGAGPRGLSHPRTRREDGVVRPLLDASRAAILEFLAERDLPFRLDPTNTGASNLRTRLRHDVIPALLRENPDLARGAGHSAALFADLDEFLEHSARAAAAALRRPGRAGEFILDGPGGRAYHRIVLSTILRNAIRGCSPTAEPGYPALDRLVRAWQAGETAGADLPGRIRVTVTRNEVVVAAGPGHPEPTEAALLALPGQAAPPDGAELSVPGEIRLEGLDASLRVEEVSPAPDDAGKRSGAGVAWMDAEEIRPPLWVRRRLPGDRYRPLGLAGSVKVQDLMVDRKIPRRWREFVPVLADQRGILWIPGFRVDDRSRITERTNTALRIEISGCLPWLAGAEQE